LTFRLVYNFKYNVLLIEVLVSRAIEAVNLGVTLDTALSFTII